MPRGVAVGIGEEAPFGHFVGLAEALHDLAVAQAGQGLLQLALPGERFAHLAETPAPRPGSGCTAPPRLHARVPAGRRPSSPARGGIHRCAGPGPQVETPVEAQPERAMEPLPAPDARACARRGRGNVQQALRSIAGCSSAACCHAARPTQRPTNNRPLSSSTSSLRIKARNPGRREVGLAVYGSARRPARRARPMPGPARCRTGCCTERPRRPSPVQPRKHPVASGTPIPSARSSNSARITPAMPQRRRSGATRVPSRTSSRLLNTLHHPLVHVQHEPFGMPGVAPLGTGEDLLQAIEVLEAASRLLGQARTAGEQAHACCQWRSG